MSRLWRWLLISAAGIVIVLVLAVLWVLHELNPSGHPGRAVDVTVPTGASVSRIADLLAADHVIAHPFWFRMYVRLHGGRFDAGVFRLRVDDSFSEAIRVLEGPTLTVRLVIPEGFTVSQIAARVGALPGHARARFLALAQSGVVRSPYEPPGTDNLEGLLFPDTYSVGYGESDRAILEQMIDSFDQMAVHVGLARTARRVGVSPYQAVIVASLIEREAKLGADRPLVAEVVYNRLKIGMRLQIDATVLYALGSGTTTLTPADLAVQSPYNTYLVTGLPPGPIANPGQAALTAALHPAHGAYLYYVVVGADGQEAFSTTLAGQEANIALAHSRGLPG